MVAVPAAVSGEAVPLQVEAEPAAVQRGAVPPRGLTAQLDEMVLLELGEGGAAA